MALGSTRSDRRGFHPSPMLRGPARRGDLALRTEAWRLESRSILRRLKRSVKSLFRPGKAARHASTAFCDMQHVDPAAIGISEALFLARIHLSDTYKAGSAGRRQYIDASSPRLYRIFSNLLRCEIAFRGPTLDVASGWGILYPCLREHLPGLLPYAVAEMTGADFTIDGQSIPCGTFECDKDRLPFPDASFGTLLFCDCLEHLIVDPVWTFLEFNRVLRPGGHLVVSTPNAAALCRVVEILGGRNPATENVLKPQAIYQRHNREWTLEEVAKLMRCCGFSPRRYSTSSFLMTRGEIALFDTLQDRGETAWTRAVFGPEIFVVAEKSAERTLASDLSLDERWPEWLYSPLAIYRKRPRVFPIVVSDDY
jgi:SAM-dependent methyltransferase